MGMIELYREHNIDVATEDSRHYREGWANVPCPYCSGNAGYHLGFNLDKCYYNCHRCGNHRVNFTLSKLLNISNIKASQIAKDFRVQYAQTILKAPIKINIRPFKFPSNTTTLTKQHKKYLALRGFDPDYIESVFDLHGTGPISQLDKISYKFRIIAPIYWENKIVSFQSRDYTNKQRRRYLTCPRKREQVHHKHILYGRNKVPQNIAILVEGIFDVWRFVDNTYATFGISYTREQVELIAKTFDQVFIVFDPEKVAQKQAIKLKKELIIKGSDVKNIILDTDPGDLSQDDANHLIKSFKIRKYVSRD